VVVEEEVVNLLMTYLICFLVVDAVEVVVDHRDLKKARTFNIPSKPLLKIYTTRRLLNSPSRETSLVLTARVVVVKKVRRRDVMIVEVVELKCLFVKLGQEWFNKSNHIAVPAKALARVWMRKINANHAKV